MSHNSSYRVIINSRGGPVTTSNDYMDASSSMNKHQTTNASSYLKKIDPTLPRKRDYRAYSIKKTTVTVPASLLKVEHEYFNSVKDQEKIILD